MSQNKYCRDILKPCVIGEISQGTIFNGAVSDIYSNCEILGVVISARCDIAQKKVPCYFYLPVVKWSDWLNTELPDLFLELLKKEKITSLKKLLVKLKVSESIIGRYKVAKIREIVEKCCKSSEKKSALSCLDALADIELYESGDIYIADLISKYSGTKKNIVDNIIGLKDPNYYFFEASDEDLYIVRLREIKSLKKDFFFKLSDGIDNPLDSTILSENDIKQLSENEIIMPLYQIQSPYIEHIIQMFVTQFNKIGVEDLSNYIKNEANS